ncbi:DUF982 domain-containing protein [Mesorhizobium sp. M7A.F.Ca.CA.001.09.2.1]|uniref:DUF982 domain-containing protein n=1 Tax=Mesorhizobium ciceri TaxID=39645 RepID=A0AB38TJA3_9HYPH|nr:MULTISPECIES: DUF982 domain-containing protein [Mesorhizobium]RUY35360.1 DUF982 domain-containing protein [Mesorhizobium sp. M7A.F.Ca.CA.001.13.2.1]MDF3217285.1 DUF982 domain-containing protein [Mesorhizobium ciceri]RUY61392.1 DUF982 domain-containing protein [Mesorhizobium sp. M7A.F.Ca.CA.001.05.1.1]RUY63306.1 DUF982 domain-containing protein [Mesorhizobium sp. M7A.F.Ca.CA.001.13.1.1]RUY79969.1 DUF982 domain-containing protein [Mesorhizobium sp. M7A.F.Ca.CA.001.09.2.1]
MPLRCFNPPVYVKTDRPGFRLGISRIDTAAEELLKWSNRGPKWRLAAEACLTAMDGKMPTNDFRVLFEDAAEEEEMLLPD